MEAIQNLPIVGVVKSHYTFQSIKEDIINRLLHIPELHLLKGTVQIVKFVCECVENLVPAGNSKPKGLHLDKKQLSLDCLQKLFDLSPTDLISASRSIDYLVESKSIKKIVKWKRIRSWFCSFFFNRNPVLDASTDPVTRTDASTA